MSSRVDDVRSAIAAVAALRAPQAGELSDAELALYVQLTEELGRHVDVLRVRAAGEVAERSRRELGSASLTRQHAQASPVHLIEKLARVSSTEAARRIRLAAATEPRVALTGEVLPARFDRVAQAFDAGDIGVDAALAIVSILAPTERVTSVDQVQAAEQNLVDQAREVSADLVRDEARLWRAALDPDGAEPRDAELRAQRRLVIGKQRDDGMTPFYGEADPVSAAQLRAWTAARMSPDARPRFLADDDPAHEHAEPGLADPRTRDQRTFDVFMGLLFAGVRAEAEVLTAKQSAANVMVVMSERVYSTGTGTVWISGNDEPISGGSAAALACDSGIQRIFLGPNGEPLALGRRERLHSAAQRKAMVVRDGPTCAWPGCTAPIQWTEAHHPRSWADGGATDVDNGVLLCRFHHRVVHDGEWQIMMRDGIPHLRAPKRLDLTGTWQRMGTRRLAHAA